MLTPTFRRGFIFKEAGVYTVEIVETYHYKNGCSRRRRILCDGTPSIETLPLAEEMQGKILAVYQAGGTIE